MTIKSAFPAISIALSSLALPALADPSHSMRPDALPLTEVIANARAKGFNPVGTPSRRGDYYVLLARDGNGAEVSVVSDALFGDIITVKPAQPRGSPGRTRNDDVAEHAKIPLPRPRPLTSLHDIGQRVNEKDRTKLQLMRATDQALPRNGRASQTLDAAPISPKRTVSSAPPPPASIHQGRRGRSE